MQHTHHAAHSERDEESFPAQAVGVGEELREKLRVQDRFVVPIHELREIELAVGTVNEACDDGKCTKYIDKL